MTNKNIASYSIVSVVVFMIALLTGGESERGFSGFMYYAGLVGFWVFLIWGWVRLFKSN